MRFGESSCSAPMSDTSCGPVPYENLQALVATNSAAGSCLAPLAGTTHGYSPSIVAPSGPCFVSSEAPLLVLPLFGGTTPLSLRHARVGATFGGNPPGSGLLNGLLLGFLTEADANNTILPASVALVGGQPLSLLLPGGHPPGTSGCCASHSDLYTGPAGERGWWMYFNFVAEPVPYTGPSVSVGRESGARLALAFPNPNRGSVALTCRLESDGPMSLTVHDIVGRRIAELESGWRTAGTHRLAWDGRRADGAAAAPGLYVIRLSCADGTIARKAVLLR